MFREAFTAHCAVAVVVASVTSVATADLIQFRRNAGQLATYNGEPVTDTTFDDVGIGTGGATLVDTGSVTTLSVNSSQVRYGLIAVNEMFDLLPKFVDDTVISITSATLYLNRINGSDTYTIGLYRVTSDWMLGATGTNVNNVNGDLRSISDNLSWASGSFSADDYTTDGSVTSAWTATPTFDITQIVQDMYDTETNNGVALRVLSGGIGSQQFTNSRRSGGRPVWAIEYTYVPIPEPASILLIGGGALLALGRRRNSGA